MSGPLHKGYDCFFSHFFLIFGHPSSNEVGERGANPVELVFTVEAYAKHIPVKARVRKHWLWFFFAIFGSHHNFPPPCGGGFLDCKILS